MEDSINWNQRMTSLPGPILEYILEEFLDEAYGKRNYAINTNYLAGTTLWANTVLRIYIPADHTLYKKKNNRPAQFYTHLTAFKHIWPVPLTIHIDVKAYSVRGDMIGYPEMLLWIREITKGLPDTVRIKIPAFHHWDLPHCLAWNGWQWYHDRAETMGHVRVMRHLKGYYTSRDLAEAEDELNEYIL